MDLTFERGDPQHPRGHALVYFRVDTEPDKVYASYVVTLPVKADLTKYVPPFLASHLGSLPLNDLSAFAMPPVPEQVDDYAELDRLSQLRGDDLVYAGSMFSFDLPRMMESVTEAVQSYAEMCPADATTAIPAQNDQLPGTVIESQGGQSVREVETEDLSYGVSEVLFSFMSESDKLGELSKLLGRLRFAVDGADQTAASEVESEIIVLARHLPENYKVTDLLDVAKDNSDRSSQLAKLYIDRCFRLSAGEAAAATELDAQIKLLRDEG